MWRADRQPGGITVAHLRLTSIPIDTGEASYL
jgi:hypothetical protein